VIVALWYLSNLGVDVTAFLASLGFVSLAIAFALRETISDLFASIVIFIDRPFEIGDAIKVDNQAGTVEKIGIRSTKIRAPEGFIMVTSNRDLTNKKIHNLKRMNARRVEMTIQIDQATPSSQLRKIPEIIEEIIKSFGDLSFDKLNLINIGDFSYDFNLVYFVNTRDFMVHAKAKQELLIQMLERFDDENIMLPYPTQTIILEE
jgi:small-conductance mechanosensitive channel